MERTLRIKRRGHVAHVTFMRRFVDPATVDDLYRFIGDLEEDRSVLAVVFHLGRTGRRPAPAGRLAPLVGEIGPHAGMTVFTRLEKVLATLERLDRPTAVVLDGPIGSVGLELALIADLTIATPETVFYVEGSERGFLPGMLLYRLARHVGVGVAKQAALHRPTIPAGRAQQYGIVDRIVRHPRRALRAELPRLLALPPATLNLARQILLEAGPVSYPQAYDSYKAAQFHALHSLNEDDSSLPDRDAGPLSAAEYIVEPLDQWIDRAGPAHAGSWQELAPRHAVGTADTDSASVLRRLDQAGIGGAVVYPETVLNAYGRLAGATMSTLLRRYNDWVLELCATAPERLRPAVLLDLDEPEAAAAEVYRTASAGAAAAVIPLPPHDDKRYDNPGYDVLWRALERYRIPITLHRGTCRGIGRDPRPFDLSLHRLGEEDELFDQVFDALEGSYARLAVVAMTLSGVFARHPGLHVVTVGFGLAWAPYALLRLDEQYEVRPERAGPPNGAAPEPGGELEGQTLAVEGRGYEFPERERPSDHFRRHVFVAVDDDDIGLELTDVFGARNILWAGQHRPSSTSARGNVPSRRLQGRLSKEERITIERRNASALYGFAAEGVSK